MLLGARPDAPAASRTQHQRPATVFASSGQRRDFSAARVLISSPARRASASARRPAGGPATKASSSSVDRGRCRRWSTTPAEVAGPPASRGHVGEQGVGSASGETPRRARQVARCSATYAEHVPRASGRGTSADQGRAAGLRSASAGSRASPRARKVAKPLLAGRRSPRPGRAGCSQVAASAWRPTLLEPPGSSRAAAAGWSRSTRKRANRAPALRRRLRHRRERASVAGQSGRAVRRSSPDSPALFLPAELREARRDQADREPIRGPVAPARRAASRSNVSSSFTTLQSQSASRGSSPSRATRSSQLASCDPVGAHQRALVPTSSFRRARSGRRRHSPSRASNSAVRDRHADRSSTLPASRPGSWAPRHPVRTCVARGRSAAACAPALGHRLLSSCKRNAPAARRPRLSMPFLQRPLELLPGAASTWRCPLSQRASTSRPPESPAAPSSPRRVRTGLPATSSSAFHRSAVVVLRVGVPLHVARMPSRNASSPSQVSSMRMNDCPFS